MRRSLLIMLSLAGSATPASAHQSSIKYVDLTIAGTRAEVAFEVAPVDVTEPMKLAPDAKPAARDAARVPAVAPYVAAWLDISVPGAAGEQPCTPTPPSAHADADNFVIVTWSVTCPIAIAHLTLAFDRFFAVDKRMEAIVRVTNDGNVAPIVVREGDSPITLRIGSSSLGRSIRAGMDVFAELDHVAFVLAILLVVVIERRATWQVRRIVTVLRAAAGVIGVFTIAHLVALFVGALGWITLTPAVVACLVGAATAYVALEDIARPDVRGRLAVVAAFGLVYGLTFAARLPVLPSSAGALAGFAVGVELSQLTLVMIALPIVYLLASVIGGERYRRLALPVLAGAVLAFGIVRVVRGGFSM